MKPEGPTRIRWQVFGLACGASFLLYLHRYTWNIVGPELQSDFQLSNTQAGFLFSLFYYTYAAAQIPSGITIDRFGPHKFLSSIILMWSVSLAVLGQASQMWLLGIWRLLFGVAQAGCYPALTQVTRQWFPASQRTTIQGWVATTCGRAGGAMSPLILGTILMGWCGLSWPSALIVLGVSGGLFGILFWCIFRNTPKQHPHVNAAEQQLIETGTPPHTETSPKLQLAPGKVLQNRSLRWFVVQQFLSAGADIVFVSLIGTYFLRARGFDISQTGWLASLPLWGGAAGGIAGGWLNDRLIRATGNRRWTRSGIGFAGKVIGCIMLALIVRQTSGLSVAWLLLLAKFFSDWGQPTTWGACTDLGGRFSATIFSIINTAGTIGGVVMPIVFGMVLDQFTTHTTIDGVLHETTDWNPLFLVLALMFLGSGICWMLVDCTRSIEVEEQQPAPAR